MFYLDRRNIGDDNIEHHVVRVTGVGHWPDLIRTQDYQVASRVCRDLNNATNEDCLRDALSDCTNIDGSWVTTIVNHWLHVKHGGPEHPPVDVQRSYPRKVKLGRSFEEPMIHHVDPSDPESKVQRAKREADRAKVYARAACNAFIQTPSATNYLRMTEEAQKYQEAKCAYYDAASAARSALRD